MWTKNFKSSAAAEDDVQEDDVEMTVEGGASRAGAPVDEDPFENRCDLDMSHKSEPQHHKDMVSHKFTQEGIFHHWTGRLSGHAHVNQTYPDVVWIWRHFKGYPVSVGGIERVLFAAGKQHDALKKKLWTRPWKAH